METFLVLNGHEIQAAIDEQEMVILRVAASRHFSMFLPPKLGLPYPAKGPAAG